MSDKLQKVPELRFKKYIDEWEKLHLSNLMLFSNGINASKENYGKGRNMISVMDILNTQPIKYENIRNSVEVNNDTEFKNKVEKGDLVFVRSSELLKEVGWAKAYLDNEYALFSGFTIRGKKKNIFNAHFIELLLNFTNRKQVERKAGGSTRFNVSQSMLNEIEILIPKIEEQDYIDEFFKQLNNIIDLNQQKYDLLCNMKQSYLQKMFPKKGEKVPEIRFEGFSDKWRDSKIGELFVERSERSDIGELISVTINSGVIKASELDRKDNSSKDKTNYKVVQKNDIAYNSMRMWQGASGYSMYNGILSPAYTVITPKKQVNSEFFSFMFKKHDMIQIFKRNSQGLTSDTWNLKFPVLSRINVKVPSIDEQQKIVSFFKQLDEIIIIRKSNLDKLEEMKKTLLKKMFV